MEKLQNEIVMGLLAGLALLLVGITYLWFRLPYLASRSGRTLSPSGQVSVYPTSTPTPLPEEPDQITGAPRVVTEDELQPSL